MLAAAGVFEAAQIAVIQTRAAQTDALSGIPVVAVERLHFPLIEIQCHLAAGTR